MRSRSPITLLLTCLFLSACGGGGTSAPPVPPPQVAPPQITTAPQSATAQFGKTASFTVAATGSGTLAYQWSRNGTAIPGATAATLTVATVSAADSGAQFAVAVSNSGGSVTSSSAALTVTYAAASGVAQKGPLQQGSTATAQELDANLSPTGKQYSYQITSNLGTFAPTSTFGANLIGLNATGYYLDEVSSQVSVGTITLNGYNELTADTVLNVNLLTTLAYQRIRNLVLGGMAFTAARIQAEGEVLAAFGIPPAAGFARFGTLDLGTNTDAGHALAAISSVFVNGNSSGALSSLISRVQADIGANGAITDTATRASLLASAQSLDAEAIAANLNVHYSSMGVSFTAANIDDWLDRDGDGLASRFKFRVLRATSASSFALPTSLTNAYAGRQVSVSAGNLQVNGSPSSGAVTIQAGDVLTVTPSAGFANGLFDTYLQTGTVRVAKLTFAGHGTWSAVGRLATRRVGQTATPLPNGRLIVVGGETGVCNLNTCATRSALASAEIYDAATSSWSAAASMSTARQYHTATLLASGKLLVTGGYAGTFPYLASAEIYDPVGNAWTPAASMSTARMQHAATLLANGKVLITGGTDGVIWHNSAEIYDPVANTWAPATSMAAARGVHTSTLLPDNSVLVVGGTDGANTRANAERYDPATNTWTQPQTMVYQRSGGFTTTMLPTGRPLVVGANASADNSSAEIYDPAVPPPPAPPPSPPNPPPPPADAWSLVSSMSIARSFHSATLLPNGRLLVAGGFTPSINVASAEIYDPVANAWTPTSSLATARSSHTSTLLPDGSVLTVGGISATGSLLASCELYW